MKSRQMPSSERSVDGSWLGRTLPAYADYKKTATGQRHTLYDRVAHETGLAANTVRRALSALAYLERKGVDLGSLSSGPPIMAIEAAARVGRIDVVAEASMLRRVLAGEGTVLEFRAEAERILAARAEPKSVSAPTVLLSHAITDALGGNYRIERVERSREDPLRPIVLVITSDNGRFGPSFAVFGFQASSSILREPNAQLLIEGTVLRSVVMGYRVVVYHDSALAELEKTVSMMSEDMSHSITFERGLLVDDLTDDEAVVRLKLRNELLERKPE